MAASIDKQLEKLRERRERDLQRMRELQLAKNKEQRKKRNHFLIQIGAIAEKIYKENNKDKDFINNDNLKKFENFLRMCEHDNYFSNAINEEVEEGAQEVENNTSWNERVEQAQENL